MYQGVFAKRGENVAEIRLNAQSCLGCLFLFYIFRNLLGKETPGRFYKGRFTAQGSVSGET